MKTMTKCKVHPDRTVEYKCSTHDELICVSCFAKAHRQCQTIDEMTVEKTEKQLESVAQQTKRLQKEIHEVGDTRLKMKKMLDGNLVKLEKDCDQYAEGMKERIDTLNIKLKGNIRSTIGDQVASYEGDIDAMSSLQNELSTKLKLINDTQKYGSASEQEAISRWTENNLKEVECQVQSFQRKTSKLYKMLPDPHLETLSDLGQIHELNKEEITVVYEQEIASCLSEEVIDEKRPKKDTTRSSSLDGLHVTGYSFDRNAILSCKSVDFNTLVAQRYAIASLDCLPDGRILVLDDLNRRLMVFNSEIGCLFCFSFREKPINFCVQPTADKSRHYVCVCFQGITEVRYFVVNKDKLTFDHRFFSRLQPVSVSPLGYQTVILYNRESACIFYVDNIEIRKMTNEIVGTSNFTRQARKIRVFDKSKESVIFILRRNYVSMYGINKSKELFSPKDWYVDLDSGEPTDVTVDGKSVYVCCRKMNCVYDISLNDKSKRKVIIENIEQPVAICYDKKSNRLFVGCRGSPVIHAFTLSLN
ncbi:uncharacterized protein LOC128218602 [Mya arenaria]|uniref:uncharacterized protein LOC128218602 n=1 Tax=Mya arenaria TaxID=6604 RepID=UPI0022E987CA|nr:uncharacterized protein LOC128218602 [Mya arenaria]